MFLKKKAQSALELVIVVGTVLFIFTGFLMAFQVSIGGKLSEKKDRELYEVVSTLRDEIALASSSSDGYQRDFVLPADILGSPYSIQFAGSSIYAVTLDGKHAVSLPSENISGPLIVGSNTISKMNGSVFFSP